MLQLQIDLEINVPVVRSVDVLQAPLVDDIQPNETKTESDYYYDLK